MCFNNNKVLPLSGVTMKKRRFCAQVHAVAVPYVSTNKYVLIITDMDTRIPPAPLPGFGMEDIPRRFREFSARIIGVAVAQISRTISGHNWSKSVTKKRNKHIVTRVWRESQTSHFHKMHYIIRCLDKHRKKYSCCNDSIEKCCWQLIRQFNYV